MPPFLHLLCSHCPCQKMAGSGEQPLPILLFPLHWWHQWHGDPRPLGRAVPLTPMGACGGADAFPSLDGYK